jgi:hypothetical protein
LWAHIFVCVCIFLCMCVWVCIFVCVCERVFSYIYFVCAHACRPVKAAAKDLFLKLPPPRSLWGHRNVSQSHATGVDFGDNRTPPFISDAAPASNSTRRLHAYSNVSLTTSSWLQYYFLVATFGFRVNFSLFFFPFHFNIRPGVWFFSRRTFRFQTRTWYPSRVEISVRRRDNIDPPRTAAVRSPRTPYRYVKFNSYVKYYVKLDDWFMDVCPCQHRFCCLTSPEKQKSSKM